MQDLLKQFDIIISAEERLTRALTHSSLSDQNYERLEFLGDRVLSLVMADALMKEFPNESEGDLAKRHTALVQGTTVAAMARKIELGNHIQLSDSERAAGGTENDHILCDVMEAVIGALFLDIGYNKTADFVRKVWGEAVQDLSEPPQDPKTALQEWSQGRGLGLPVYDLVGQSGPDHAPIFEIQVTVEGQPAHTAKGANKREAQKLAAQSLLDTLQSQDK